MKKFLFIIFFLTFIIFITRSILLYNIEPIGDSSFYIWWINSISNSNHLFPHEQINHNFIDAIKIDKSSVIHNLLLPIYISVTTIFTIVSLLYFSIGNIFFENIVSGNIILSILANSLSILIIPLYLYIFRKDYFNLKEIISFSVLFILLISTSSFFFAFSTIGPHNLGILFLYLHITFFSKYFYNLENKKVKKKLLFFFLIIQIFAFYSMYTNIFLIPIFIFINLIFFSKIKFKKRIFEMLKISFLTFLILVPGLIALVIIEKFGIREDNFQGFFGWGKWAFNLDHYSIDPDLNYNLNNGLTYLTKNIQHWFYYNALVLGKINLGIAILGIILFKLKYNNSILLSLLLSHFIISLVMVGFNFAASRTYAYLFPLFYFGITLVYFVLFKLIKKFKNEYTRVFLSIFLVLLIFTYQIKFNFKKFQDLSIIKGSWSGIYQKENKNVWKNLSNDILDTINDKSLIITSTSTSKYFLENQINNINYVFFSSLDTLETNPDNIKLLMYKSNIKKKIDDGYQIYFFSFDENNFKAQQENIIKVFCKINNKVCNSKFRMIKKIISKNTWWKNFYIFEFSS